MTCLIMPFVSGPCSICQAFADPAHVTDGVVTCRECCTEHRTASHDWGAEVRGVGEQVGLFEKEG